MIISIHVVIITKKTFHSVQGYYTVEVISCVSLPQYSSSSGRGIIILLNRTSL